MTYFRDLSEYCYLETDTKGSKNVGWLGSGHEFKKMIAPDEILDRLWAFCRISVNETRGIHECEFCPPGDWHHAARRGETLLIGAAEIRVFGRGSCVYAAPNLIYHYMSTHNYWPPEEFITALKEGPAPPDEGYFKRFDELGIEWTRTPEPRC